MSDQASVKPPKLLSSANIPSKIFLLGEYAVLDGYPALLAALPPRFELKIFSHPKAPDEKHKIPFSEGSPAELFIKEVIKRGQIDKAKIDNEIEFKFIDPYKGDGGLGGSSAEFALLYYSLNENATAESAWKFYRKILSERKIQGPVPSGADLVAQITGGFVCFYPDSMTVKKLDLTFPWNNLWVFQASHKAGRKVATHEHLMSLGDKQKIASFPGAYKSTLEELGALVSEAVEVVADMNVVKFGELLTKYADVLHSVGWELGEAYEDRKAMSLLPGVLGVKGAGAMQSDVLLVWLNTDASQSEKDEVLLLAGKRGLKPLVLGLSEEPGIEVSLES